MKIQTFGIGIAIFLLSITNAGGQEGSTNNEEDTESKKSSTGIDFDELGFGVGVAYITDAEGRDRVESAQLVNGIVRVEEDSNERIGLMLETHYFLAPPRVRKNIRLNIEEVLRFEQKNKRIKLQYEACKDKDGESIKRVSQVDEIFRVKGRPPELDSLKLKESEEKISMHEFVSTCRAFVNEVRKIYKDPEDPNGFNRQKGSGGVGYGPFIAVQPGSENFVEALALGMMVGIRKFSPTNNSMNIGVGVSFEQDVKILGDGIEANKPLPPGETEIRFKEDLKLGYILIVSFTF